MIKIEIILPLYYNDGKKIESNKYNDIKNVLIGHYGGLSIENNINGYWLNNNDNKLYEDKNIKYVVVTDNFDNNVLDGIKKWLKVLLNQIDIFILKSDVSII